MPRGLRNCLLQFNRFARGYKGGRPHAAAARHASLVRQPRRHGSRAERRVVVGPRRAAAGGGGGGGGRRAAAAAGRRAAKLNARQAQL